MSNLYVNRFKHFLKEADEMDDLGNMERNAMASSLDDDVSPEDFDTDLDNVDQAQTQLADAISKRNEQIVSELQSWIDSIESFLEMLNGEGDSSIQSRLANAEADTVFDKMKQSQQTKISRVASDLAALHQGFLGFMAQTKNPKYRYV